MAKGQENTDKLVDTLRKWQQIERKSIDSCADIMEKTDNSLIRQFMEIIRNDSVQHHRVQQFIIDSLTKELAIDIPKQTKHSGAPCERAWAGARRTDAKTQCVS